MVRIVWIVEFVRFSFLLPFCALILTLLAFSLELWAFLLSSPFPISASPFRIPTYVLWNLSRFDLTFLPSQPPTFSLFRVPNSAFPPGRRHRPLWAGSRIQTLPQTSDLHRPKAFHHQLPVIPIEGRLIFWIWVIGIYLLFGICCLGFNVSQGSLFSPSREVCLAELSRARARGGLKLWKP